MPNYDKDLIVGHKRFLWLFYLWIIINGLIIMTNVLIAIASEEYDLQLETSENDINLQMSMDNSNSMWLYNLFGKYKK